MNLLFLFQCFPGLVEDSKVAYKWLMKKADGRAVYLWGHSLGTAYVFTFCLV